MKRLCCATVACVVALVSASSFAAVFDPEVEDRFPTEQITQKIQKKFNDDQGWANIASYFKAMQQGCDFVPVVDNPLFVDVKDNGLGGYRVRYIKRWSSQLNLRQDPSKRVTFYHNYYSTYHCQEYNQAGSVDFECWEQSHQYSIYVTTPPNPAVWDPSTIPYILDTHHNRLGENSPLRESLPEHISSRMNDAVLGQENIVPMQTDVDLFPCSIATPQYKKFCSLNGKMRSETHSMPRQVAVEGAVYDVYDVFERLYSGNYGEYEDLAFYFYDLYPQLKFQLVWSNEPACWPSGLTNDEISIYSNLGYRNEEVLGDLRVGYDHYAFELTDYAERPLWTLLTGEQGVPEDEFVIRSDYYQVRDLSGTEIWRNQRIPKECVFGMNDLHVSFDKDEIMRETMPKLQKDVADLNENMADKIVLHGLYLDDVSGAQCAVFEITRSVLRSLNLATGIDVKTEPTEVVRNLRANCGFQFLDLYLTFVSAMSRAAGQGTLPGNPEPEQYPSYYADNYQEFAEACSRVGTNIFIPHEGAFADFADPLKSAGIDNARKYQEKAAELHRILTFAWAMAKAAKSPFAAERDYWMMSQFRD